MNTTIQKTRDFLKRENGKKKNAKEDEYCCDGGGLLGFTRAVEVVVLDWSGDASALLKSGEKLKEKKR